MAERKPKSSSSKEVEVRRPRRPATTLESRENQLISAAIDLAERQIEDGSASSQIIVHYLKLGSPREKLERERLQKENELLRAKVESMASGKRVEELYGDAIKAMRAYSGRDVSDDEDFIEGEIVDDY